MKLLSDRAPAATAPRGSVLSTFSIAATCFGLLLASVLLTVWVETWMCSAMDMQQSTVYAEILTSIAYTLQEQGDIVPTPGNLQM